MQKNQEDEFINPPFLSSPSALKILKAVLSEGKTVYKLIKENGIPASTAVSYTRKLVYGGYLKAQPINRKGRKTIVYTITQKGMVACILGNPIDLKQYKDVFLPNVKKIPEFQSPIWNYLLEYYPEMALKSIKKYGEYVSERDVIDDLIDGTYYKRADSRVSKVMLAILSRFKDEALNFKKSDLEERRETFELRLRKIEQEIGFLNELK